MPGPESPKRPPRRPRSPVSMYVAFDGYAPRAPPPKPLLRLEKKKSLTKGKEKELEKLVVPSPPSKPITTPASPVSSFFRGKLQRKSSSASSVSSSKYRLHIPLAESLLPPTPAPSTHTPTGKWARRTNRAPRAPAIDWDELDTRECEVLDISPQPQRRRGTAGLETIEDYSDGAEELDDMTFAKPDSSPQPPPLDDMTFAEPDSPASPQPPPSPLPSDLDDMTFAVPSDRESGFWAEHTTPRLVRQPTASSLSTIAFMETASYASSTVSLDSARYASPTPMRFSNPSRPPSVVIPASSPSPRPHRMPSELFVMDGPGSPGSSASEYSISDGDGDGDGDGDAESEWPLTPESESSASQFSSHPSLLPVPAGQQQRGVAQPPASVHVEMNAILSSPRHVVRVQVLGEWNYDGGVAEKRRSLVE
ncbi:hypothetical protein C8F01DRAFT_1094518 [Mycena amicta]|nr:hypothetical protein C8F01DRAFT_1094518 [Mycena amicta]